jgi:hypothetical protein
MADREQAIRISRFDGGINQQDKPWLLRDNEAQELREIDLEKSGSSGALTRRLGHTKYFSSQASAAANMKSVYIYTKKDGTVKRVCNGGTKTFTFTTTAATTMGMSVSSDSTCRYVTFKDTLYFVNGAASLMKYDGSSAAKVTSPASAKYIGVYQNRVWLANKTSSSSWVWHSALRNGEDWTTSENAGNVKINEDDGDIITGIVPQKNRLLVFKKWAIYGLYGYKVDNFYWKLLTSGIGCVAPSSIAVLGQKVFFFANDGLYVLSGDSDEPILLSKKVTPIIDAISNKATCAGGLYKNQYWLSYYVSGSTKNNRCLVLNFQKGAWAEYRGIPANGFAWDRDAGIFFAAGANSGMIYKCDNGTSDNGAAIPVYYKSPAFVAGAPEREKHFKKIRTTAKATGSITATLNYWVDFVDRSDPRTISVASGASTSIKTNRQLLEQGSNGRYLELALGQTNGTTDFQVYDMTVYATVKEDV